MEKRSNDTNYWKCISIAVTAGKATFRFESPSTANTTFCSQEKRYTATPSVIRKQQTFSGYGVTKKCERGREVYETKIQERQRYDSNPMFIMGDIDPVVYKEKQPSLLHNNEWTAPSETFAVTFLVHWRSQRTELGNNVPFTLFE
ncbi:hypothetical protein TNCV_3423401 [Trichonephila clavipes]|nr:hypothetical protein TNCV_3423401 [Trichonephila clavipes]